MSPSNPTELERRVADVLQQHAEIAMTRTDTETQYVDFLESTVPEVRRRRMVWSIGALAAAAAVVVALVLGGLPGVSKDAEQKLEPATTGPATTGPATTGARTPVEVADDFVEALSVYDIAAASRDVVGVADRLGIWPGDTPPLEQGMAWAKAAGFRVMPQGCSLSRLADGMQVVTCPFAWHFLGSDRLGRPPEEGQLSIFVRSGMIHYASSTIGWKQTGLRHDDGLWGPFDRWMERENPVAAAQMIAMDEAAGGPGYRAPFWTAGTSYDLWSEYVDKWVASKQ